MVEGKVLFGILLIFWTFIILAILMALSFPCKYLLSDSKLTIRSGMVTDPIYLSSIESLTKVRNAKAAPALSLDRVELKLKDGTERVISPKERDEFLAEVKKRQKQTVSEEGD